MSDKLINDYIKPYEDVIFNKSYETVYFPYSNGHYTSMPIFSLLIFDGGAYFLIKELMSVSEDLDPCSRKFFEFFSSSDLFSFWEKNGCFDWDLKYQAAKNSELPFDAEHHVFINRLYFLLLPAQEYLLTKNEEWALSWINWLRSWDDTHPYNDNGDIIWRDMQVAWRMLVFIHSIKMLSESKALDKNDWIFIYSLAEKHAGRLCAEGTEQLKVGRIHNHTLQIGLVLLMSGVLFPMFEEAESYICLGRRIIETNMTKAIYNDGGSAEGSPSYSHFIARMYLEAYLILEKNNLQPINGLEECIRSQYLWLFQMTAPTGKSLQISDSYALNALRDLDIANNLLDLKLPSKPVSVILKDSKFASLRNGKFDVFIDAMERTQGHQHRGVPNIIAFCDKLPLVIDGGCCVYDRIDLYEYLKSPGAHNTVTIKNELGEITNNGKEKISITNSNFIGENPYMEICVDGNGYSHTRHVSLSDESGLCIHDVIKSEEPVYCAAALHFAPSKAMLESPRKAIISLNEEDIIITLKGTADYFELGVSPAVNDKNNLFYATKLTCASYGSCVEFIIMINGGLTNAT